MANKWLTIQTTGLPNATIQDIIHLMDQSLHLRGGQRNNPSHPGWKEGIAGIIELCKTNNWDPVEYSLAQMENPSHGGAYLISINRPICHTLLRGPKATQRYKDRMHAGVRHHRNHHLTCAVAIGSLALRDFMFFDKSWIESLSDALSGLDTDAEEWKKVTPEEHRELRWHLHPIFAAYFLDVTAKWRRQHTDCGNRIERFFLTMPPEDWTFPSEKDRCYSLLRSQGVVLTDLYEDSDKNDNREYPKYDPRLGFGFVK